MPLAATHKRTSLYYIGQYTPWLHAIIDAASKGDLKSAHRFLFHDYKFLKLIDDIFGRELAREALLHMILDLEQYRAKKVLPIPSKTKELKSKWA